MNCNIRLAKISDCNELSKVKQEIWQSTYRGIYSDDIIDNFDYEKHKVSFENKINNPDIELYVAEYDDKIIGYMDYGIPIRTFKDYKQEIGLLYLLKKYQGKGIGRQLFDLAYYNIKENGFDEFFISCNKYNTSAQKFYEKMGGKIIHVDDDIEDKSIPQIIYLYKIK